MNLSYIQKHRKKSWTDLSMLTQFVILLLFLFIFYLFFVIGFLHNRTAVYKQDVSTGIERQIRIIQRDFGESVINNTNAQSRDNIQILIE